ncbi:hypothetical protein NDU88_002881 [Pleurodeles waltl]|uniref:Reverse transcriptase domain-containing protein n=1 Tax=Pleurodeles waltl TaxID=8319 RepID=A0AAV7M3S7_PLEWA|nr:hypothetical protein NDU88_002881 [Pleurodeles waltl]
MPSRASRSQHQSTGSDAQKGALQPPKAHKRRVLEAQLRTGKKLGLTAQSRAVCKKLRGLEPDLSDRQRSSNDSGWPPGLPLVQNLKSVKDNPTVARQKIAKELALGRIAGPYSQPPMDKFIVSPIGVVPKKEVGKFKLIYHLSYPTGESVNDGLGQDSCSVSYTIVDDVVDRIRVAGRGALLANTDIESAFRFLPVHPDSYQLLGFQMDESFYNENACQWVAPSPVLILKHLVHSLNG